MQLESKSLIWVIKIQHGLQTEADPSFVICVQAEELKDKKEKEFKEISEVAKKEVSSYLCSEI